MANTTNKMPRMYDIEPYIEAGINPNTGLPEKMLPNALKNDVKRQLCVLDEQDAINRFTWYNLPSGLSGRLMERILYYRGQGMFFKLRDRFFFLPYALSGSIDVYGRFEEVTPLPFNGRSQANGKDTPWITGLTRKCVYEVAYPDDYINKEGVILVEKITNAQEESCVLIKDYSEQISQTIIGRNILQDPVIDIMSEMFPFMHTALLNGTGIEGMRVPSQDNYASVEAASRAVNRAALEGKKWVPVVGDIDFQSLTKGAVAKAEEYLLAMQALDNYRLSLYGLDNGGLFQKKSHMLEAEQRMNTGTTGLIFKDSLQYRQDACTIINSIWGLNMWCMPSEAVLAMDLNNNGVSGDDDPSYGTEDIDDVEGGEDNGDTT